MPLGSGACVLRRMDEALGRPLRALYRAHLPQVVWPWPLCPAQPVPLSRRHHGQLVFGGAAHFPNDVVANERLLLVGFHQRAGP